MPGMAEKPSRSCRRTLSAVSELCWSYRAPQTSSSRLGHAPGILMRLCQTGASGGAGSVARPWGAAPQPPQPHVTAHAASASAAPSLGGGGGGQALPAGPMGPGQSQRHPRPKQEEREGDRGVP